MTKACAHCGTTVEFDESWLGKTAECPTCKQPIGLGIEVRKGKPPQQIHRGAIIAIAGVLLLAGFATLGWVLENGGKADGSAIAGNGIQNIFFAGLLVLCLMVVIAWIWFPFMVQKRLNTMIALLEEIKRKP